MAPLLAHLVPEQRKLRIVADLPARRSLGDPVLRRLRRDALALKLLQLLVVLAKASLQCEMRVARKTRKSRCFLQDLPREQIMDPQPVSLHDVLRLDRDCFQRLGQSGEAGRFALVPHAKVIDPVGKPLRVLQRAAIPDLQPTQRPVAAPLPGIQIQFRDLDECVTLGQMILPAFLNPGAELRQPVKEGAIQMPIDGAAQHIRPELAIQHARERCGVLG